MCWKCNELDAVIAHYRGLRTRLADQGSLKALGVLIERFEGDKKALHQPEPTAGSGT
jgi:hypothetical protein